MSNNEITQLKNFKTGPIFEHSVFAALFRHNKAIQETKCTARIR